VATGILYLKTKAITPSNRIQLFERAFKLYCFDRELRLVLLREIEKIEVAVRSQMNHILAHEKGVYWFTEEELFRDKEKFKQSLDNLKEDVKRGDEQFIKSFKENYSNEFPPCWMILEVTSFGSLSMIYENLRHGKTKRMISEYFGLDRKSFTSWLHTLVYIRNVCAHHNRLWNRILSVQPRIPRSPREQWLNNGTENKKLYFVLSMIVYLLNTVNPNHSFVERLTTLLEKYPKADRGAMGFPDNWKTEPLWQY